MRRGASTSTAPCGSRATPFRPLPVAFVIFLAAGPTEAVTLLPDFSRARFEAGQQVHHPYFPLVPGSRVVLRARGEDDQGDPFTERSVLRVLHRKGPRIAGLRPVIQLDRAFEDGVLVEETFDYFAQDTRGNVWYLGEDVTNYHYDDDGNLIGTDSDSAWRAGVNGADPGWIMPARLRIGQRYFQEHARRDGALDKAETHAILRRLDVGGMTYRQVLQVLEINPLAREREFKYYAPGFGPIRFEEGLDGNLENPEVVFNRVHHGAGGTAGGAPRSSVAVAPVPLPHPIGLLVTCFGILAGLSGLRFRQRRR